MCRQVLEDGKGATMVVGTPGPHMPLLIIWEGLAPCKAPYTDDHVRSGVVHIYCRPCLLLQLLPLLTIESS
jgi:hypothetical protein